VLLLASVIPAARSDERIVPALAITLVVGLLVHLVIISAEHLVMPSPTRHHELAAVAIRRGAFATTFWFGAIGAAAAAVVAAILAAGPGAPFAITLAALLALGGSFAWEYVWVAAGQSVPLS